MCVGVGSEGARKWARKRVWMRKDYGRGCCAEQYLRAVPKSRTLELPAPPRARPAGATPAARKALASKRQTAMRVTETRKMATKVKERALSAWRGSGGAGKRVYGGTRWGIFAQ